MTRLLPLLALILSACGNPDRAPPLGGNLTDDVHGAHAGSFRRPGAGNDSQAADANMQAGNSQ